MSQNNSSTAGVYFLKCFIGTFLLILTLFSNVLGQVSWMPVGPGAGSDMLTAVFQPDNPDVIYIAGDIEGVFKTTDGGQTWYFKNKGLNDGNRSADNYGVQELVIDPADYQTIYACTWKGLFRSTNGAENWEFIFDKPYRNETLPISFLAIDPDNSNILYAGVGDSDTNADGQGSVYRSSDGGENWTLIENIGMSDTAVVHGIVVDPTSPVGNRSIFVSTGDGVFRSTDNGSTWSRINSGLPHQNTRRLKYYHSGGTFTLFLGLKSEGDLSDSSSWQGGIYKSADGGDNWVSINGNLPAKPYDDPEPPFYDYWKWVVNPTDPDILYAATNFANWAPLYGIWKTTNGGSNWVRTTDNVQYGWLDRDFEEEDNYTALAISPSNPDILISAGTYVRKTTDAAVTWVQTYTDNVGGGAWKGRGMELMIVQDIAFDMTDPDILYVSYDDYGIFRSDDSGNSYVRLDPKLGPYHEEGHDAAGSIVVDPVNGEVYLGRNNGDTVEWGEGFPLGKVWKSSDKGVTWTEITNGLPVGRPELVMDKTSPTDARVLYCAIYNNGVYKTTNSGASWTAVNNGLGSDGNYAYRLVMDPSNSQTLYLGLNTIDGTGGGIYRTTDGGANWVKLTGFGTYDVLDIAVDPNNPQTVYAGAVDSYDWTSDGGLYKSADGGTSWTRIFDQPRVRRILVHPNDSNMLFASSSSWYQVFPDAVTGFYRSTDGGNSWTHISEGLQHNYIYDAEFNPHNLNQIYIGTHGGGLWLLDNVTTSVDEEDRAIPGVFKLSQNYPNPFNPVTTIEYSLPRVSEVLLVIYNLRGEEVARLVDAQQQSGYHKVIWNASDVATGVYFYRLQTRDFVRTKKMIMLK